MDFKKLFIVSLVFFVLLCTKSISEIVNKITVEGNQKVSAETIVIFGDVTLGKDYTQQELNLLIKKLFETTYFNNISVELENNELKIIVEENPIINTLVFKGENAKKYKETLRELLQLKEKSAFFSSNIKHDINLIKEFYRAQGFYFVKIEAQVEKLKNNRVNLIFTLHFLQLIY